MAKHKVYKTYPLRKYIIISLFVFLFIGIGYSILSTSLSLSGNINVSKYDQTLYGVFEKGVREGIAQEYTGEHHDSYIEEPSKKIYHWRATSSEQVTEINNKRNIIFGGFCWQTIRTTDTGGVKIIFNGIPNSGKCNKSGSGQMIGTSNFNDNNNTPASVGYMHNKIYPNTLKEENEILIPNSTRFYNNNYYSDSVVWNQETEKWELENPYTVSYARDTIGLYTFSTNIENYSSSSVYYILGNSSSSLYYIKLEEGHNPSYYDYVISYGDDYINNGDGTFSLVSPQSISFLNYYNDYYKIDDKYICINENNNICNEMRYVTSSFSTSYDYMSTTNYYKYASGFVYNETTNKYQLNNDYVYVWEYLNDVEKAKISNHHYTFLNETEESDTIYYVYAVDSSQGHLAYISLSGGETSEDALYNMLYSDDVNKNNSKVKTVVDNWYSNNMLPYNTYIEDTIFCNNREQSNSDTNGWNSNGGNVGKEISFGINTRQLECINETDKFSVSNPKAQLTYPVGLVSAKELSLQGWSQLYTIGQNYWTLTPGNYNKQYAVGGAVIRIVSYSDIRLTPSYDISNGVRPVVSLRPGIKYTSGTGSVDDPYIIDAPPIGS